MVTHDPRAAAYADRVLFLADGRVVDELLAPDGRPRPRRASQRSWATWSAAMWRVTLQGRRGAPAPLRAHRARGAARRRVHRRHLRAHRHHQPHLQRPVSTRSTRARPRWSGPPQPFNPGTQLRQPAAADRRQHRRPRWPRCPASGRSPSTSRATPSSSARNGKPIGTAANGPPTLGVAWTDVAALNPLRLLPGGHPPRTRRPGGDRQALRRRRALQGRRHGDRPHPAARHLHRSPASPPGAARTARSARPSPRSTRRPPSGCSASPARSTRSTSRPRPASRSTSW